MIPANILKAIGITLKQVIESAASALDLRAALKIAAKSGDGNPKGTFFRFINAAKKEGMSGKDAAVAYKEAQYWTNQGKILSQYDSTTPLDPTLARVITGKGQYAGEYAKYRTEVSATVTDPETGKSRDFGFHVLTDDPPNMEDLIGLATPELSSVLGTSPLVAGQTDLWDYDIQWSIVDFGKFT